MIPQKAFILAAGFGTRLRPLTDHIPKPMVCIQGRSMLERTIDHLQAIGINECVINTHYKGKIIHDHFKGRDNIHLSHEEHILDTGGGIVNALSHFNGEDFYVLSGDGLWSDANPERTTLKRMQHAWDPKKMDILMLLQPIASMKITHGVGDYDLDNQGRATRSLDQNGQYMFTSIRINKSSIFDNPPQEPFSYLRLMDKAQEQGRLYGLVNDGTWYHISTPQDLAAAEKAYQESV